MRFRTTALILTLAVAAVAAGCGEKSEPEPTAPPKQITTGAGSKQENGGSPQTGGGQQGGGSPQAGQPKEVESAVETVLGGADTNDACSALVTQTYVKQSYGDEQGCRKAVAKRGEFSVAVTAVKINGDTATAKAKPSAGPNKGESISVELVDEDGTWKVASAKSNAKPGP